MERKALQLPREPRLLGDNEAWSAFDQRHPGSDWRGKRNVRLFRPFRDWRASLDHGFSIRSFSMVHLADRARFLPLGPKLNTTHLAMQANRYLQHDLCVVSDGTRYHGAGLSVPWRENIRLPEVWARYKYDLPAVPPNW